VPPTSPAPDNLPEFAIPWPYEVRRASHAMPCGCGRRTVRPDEVYVVIGNYGRINCWGCLVYYGWAALDDVPEAIRPEILAAQRRGAGS
jgi:hypothetical protein